MQAIESLVDVCLMGEVVGVVRRDALADKRVAVRRELELEQLADGSGCIAYLGAMVEGAFGSALPTHWLQLSVRATLGAQNSSGAAQKVRP